MKPYQLHHGDCLEVLATMADNSVDAVVTDPPYGLSQHKQTDIVKALTAWINGEEYTHNKKGFMGKTWDSFVPGPEMWREVYRVLKPGGHALVFAGTRTQDLMAIALRLAGFEYRDTIMWTYGCLDEQTEVATIDGVKPYHKTMVGDLVLCYDIETGGYKYQPILEIVEYEYSDTAYRLVGDFGEQVVSRNHRCIVERGGREVFQFAETLQQQACVPFLEDLSILQQALCSAHQGASNQEQDLFCSVQRQPYINSQERENCSGRKSESICGTLCGLRKRNDPFQLSSQKNKSTCMQQAMQRSSEGGSIQSSCSQRSQQLASGIGAGVGRADDWGEQSGMEGWAHLSQSERSLRKSVDQVCAVSSRVYSDGPKRWLRNGAPIDSSSSHWQAIDSNRVRSPHQPRCNGQQDSESNAVQDECGAQRIRAWQGHKTSVVRVVPFHYTGKVWCLRVPTGAFVAVRNGVAFPTGNSGFPKNLDVGKQLDRIAGAEREVITTNITKSGGMAHIMKTNVQHGYRPSDYYSEQGNVINVTAPATDAARQCASARHRRDQH